MIIWLVILSVLTAWFMLKFYLLEMDSLRAKHKLIDSLERIERLENKLSNMASNLLDDL